MDNKNEKVGIRAPEATRPWQHVLEPLSGFLLPGRKMLEGRKEFAEAWNLGPSDALHMTVGEIAEQVKKIWPKLILKSGNQPISRTRLEGSISTAPKQGAC